MPRASCLVALLVLPALTGCMTYSTEGKLPPAQAVPQYVPPVPAVPPATVAYPAPQVSPPPLRPAECLPAPLVVAVANVHKEPISLFTVRGDELRFVAQVQPGDALDVPTSAGSKLAATFAGAPHCANYVVKGQAGEVWLLRPAVPVVVPVTSAPNCTPTPIGTPTYSAR